MKFSPKYRSKILGMIYIILGSFCSFLDWKGADIGPKNQAQENPCVMWWIIMLLFFLKVDSQVDLNVSLAAQEFCYVVDHHAGIFCFPGVKFSHCPKWKLGDFFPNFEQKIPILKKVSFFFLRIFTHHTSYMVTIYYHCILFISPSI